MSPRVAVIGAGIAGIACASALVEAGIDVTIFDKGRAAGGRLSTRRSGRATFDHCAPEVSAKGTRLAAILATAEAAGAASAWGDPHTFVGLPGASALPRFLARDLDVRCSTAIVAVEGRPGDWRLRSDAGERFGGYDLVVVAVPAPQAVPLLGDSLLLRRRASLARFDPCWTIMAAFDRPLGPAWDVVPVHGSPIATLSRESAKPGRSAAPECWVLHANPEWSRRHLEEDPQDVSRLLLQALSELTLRGTRTPALVQAHRWRFARVASPAPGTVVFDPVARLGICGDWVLGPNAEDAFESGIALAATILAQHRLSTGSLNRAAR